LLVGLSQGNKEKNIALVLGVPLAIATMHFSWAAGFIASIFKKIKSKES